jgi:hypothetical protein
MHLKGFTPTHPFDFTNMKEVVDLLIEKNGCNIGIVVD